MNGKAKVAETETSYQLAGKRVWVAGHGGLVGSALMRRLATEQWELLTVSRSSLDLRRQKETEAWIGDNKPDVIVIAAATVGGIMANKTRPAEFLYDNLQIENNIVHSAWLNGVEKLLFLGSSCIYPRDIPQPMNEEALLTAPLEPTNEYYAIAKISGIKMCQAYRKQYGCDFISAQPNNLYGPGDNFDIASSHVIPALIVKAHQAKIAGEQRIEIWGTGTPKREFLYIDDLADALVFLIKQYSEPLQLNIGTGDEVSIRELAEAVIEVVGFSGDLAFDTSKPDGSPRKLLDTTRLDNLGWKAKTELREGLEKTYAWYLKTMPG